MCAGENHLPTRVYVATYAVAGLATALVIDPTLLEERSNPGPGVLDPFVGYGTSFLFVSTVAVATLDAGRFHWSRHITFRVQATAFLFVVATTALQIWAMAVNPFFSSAVRLQTERGHRVITHGPYRFVRHPGYFAMLLVMPATAVALGSRLALGPAFLYSAVIFRRTIREDRFLKERLPGYPCYMLRVRYRLVPGLW